MRSTHTTTTKPLSSRTFTLPVGAALIGLAAASAITVAQPLSAKPETITISAVAGPGGSQSSESVQSASITDGDLTVKVTKRVTSTTDEQGETKREESSETTATLGGKPVPADRVRNTNGKIEILDGKGAVVRSIAAPDLSGESVTLNVLGSTGGNLRLFGNAGSTGAPGGQVKGMQAIPFNSLAFATTEHPKVMLGVTMESPEESTATQLGVDADETTLIVTVSPDLPAAKAGVQQHDVVVAVDGEKPAPPSKIREALQAKEPGQTLELSLLRGGQPKDVTITLEAWDAERLGLDATTMGFHVIGPSPSVPQYLDEALRQQIEEMMKQFQNFDASTGLDREAFLQQLFAPVPSQGKNGQSRTFRFFGPHGGPPAGSAAPGAPASGPNNTESRMKELEDRIDRLNATIERLEAALNATQGVEKGDKKGEKDSPGR